MHDTINIQTVENRGEVTKLRIIKKDIKMSVGLDEAARVRGLRNGERNRETKK